MENIFFDVDRLAPRAGLNRHKASKRPRTDPMMYIVLPPVIQPH